MAEAPDGDPAADSEFIEVEVIYAEPLRQVAVRLRLAPGSTLRHAIEASGMVRSFPEIDLANSKLGIYGKIVVAETVLSAGDRIEIYRPLLADPKDIRRRRAADDVRSRRKAKR